MLRRFGSGRLNGREPFEKQEINIMEGIANLADVMLVFACGLMLALIINWNVDVGATAQQVKVDMSKEITELEGLSNNENEDITKSGDYESYGTVYRDKETGALYVVTDNSEEADERR